MIYFRFFRFAVMEQKSASHNTFQRIILFLNVVAAISLYISQVCAYVSPAHFWWTELLAISYPYFLIINIIFIFFWIFVRVRWMLVSVIVILAGFTHLTLFYQIGKRQGKKEGRTFSLLSYNVRLFDLYNWTGNLKTRASIFEKLNAEQPDIICFQEYYNQDKGDFQNTDALKKFLAARNAHVEYGITLRKTDHWGLATFSRFPIVGRGRVIYEENSTNFGLYTDVKIDDDTVRIYNVHLQSNHFQEKDYRFIEDPDSGSNSQILQSAKAILRRLKGGAVKRAQQVQDLKLHMNSSPYPVILCGDFNDPPFSFAYHVLSEDLNDTFKECGNGMDATYIGKIPFFRIDYVLHDDHVACISHDVGDIKLSDHEPVKVELEMRNSR
jgi:endonuclease/exonuclease/phosphatase family metal-dependent hydrolase